MNTAEINTTEGRGPADLARVEGQASFTRSRGGVFYEDTVAQRFPGSENLVGCLT